MNTISYLTFLILVFHSGSFRVFCVDARTSAGYFLGLLLSLEAARGSVDSKKSRTAGPPPGLATPSWLDAGLSRLWIMNNGPFPQSERKGGDKHVQGLTQPLAKSNMYATIITLRYLQLKWKPRSYLSRANVCQDHHLWVTGNLGFCLFNWFCSQNPKVRPSRWITEPLHWHQHLHTNCTFNFPRFLPFGPRKWRRDLGRVCWRRGMTVLATAKTAAFMVEVLWLSSLQPTRSQNRKANSEPETQPSEAVETPTPSLPQSNAPSLNNVPSPHWLALLLVDWLREKVGGTRRAPWWGGNF